MAKIRSSNRKKNGIIELKIVVKKLQKSFSLGKKSSNSYEEVNDDTKWVPKDVKEGHFAVLANGEEPKRLVVPLRYLTHPKFSRLLDQAAEEYGFDHEGALTIPCQPRECEGFWKSNGRKRVMRLMLMTIGVQRVKQWCKVIETRESRSWPFRYHF